MIACFLWKIQLWSMIWYYIRRNIIAIYDKKQECKRCIVWCTCIDEEYDDLEKGIDKED